MAPRIVSSAPGYGRPIKQPLGKTEELRAREGYASQPYQRKFTQPMDWEEDEYEEETPPPPPRKPNKKAKKKRLNWLWSLVALTAFLLLAALGVLMVPQLLGIHFMGLPNLAFVNGAVVALDGSTYADYRAYRQYMNTEAIYPGVYIDGIDVGGMTKAEAISVVNNAHDTNESPFCVSVTIGNASWNVDSSLVPVARDTQQVVEQAWALGRQNTTAIRGTGTTPFMERVRQAETLRSNPVSLYTTMSYDHEALRSVTDQMAATVNHPATNASVTSFDYNTKQFAFHEDVPGVWLDSETLYQRVEACMDSGSQFASVIMEP